MIHSALSMLPEWKKIDLALDDIPVHAIYRLSAAANGNFVLANLHHLNEEETNKAKRYRRPADQFRHLTGRLALRILLAKHLQMPPIQISIGKGTYGKPYLTDFPSLSFNISHAGDIVLIAISEHEVGVDVEEINDKFRYQDLLANLFSAEENQYINKHKNPLHAFYLLWTRKEAFLKQQGSGLTASIQDVPAISHRIRNLYLESFQPTNGYIASTCRATLKPFAYYQLNLTQSSLTF